VKLNSLLKAKPIILTFAIVCGLTGSHLQSQEKNVPERLDEADLNVIAEIRADRQKLFDDAIAENKSKVSDLQETIRRQKAGKELVVPSWFSLGVMGRMPDYPQLGIKQLEQEMMSQRREAARLKRLTPLEFVVDLIDAYGELNNLNSKIDRDARQVVLGKMQFNVLADFALPLETQYRYTRPDGSQYVDSEAEIGNWMVRNMMEAAIKAAEQQAEANRMAVEKHGNVIRVDLLRLSPNCLRVSKAAFVEKRLEAARKREEERPRIADQWRDGLVSKLREQVTQLRANEKAQTNALRRSRAPRETVNEMSDKYRNARELLDKRISELQSLEGEELLIAKEAADEKQREEAARQVREANERLREANASQRTTDLRLQMARDRFGNVALKPCPNCGPTSGICRLCGGSMYVPAE
jgi:hypothetical protein